MKKLLSFIFLLLTSIILISCKNNVNANIVTTLYPQYDIAREIVGDKLSVSLLTPVGSEVHGYTPTAKDIVGIKNANLFLYTSNNMERWVSDLIKTNDINYVDLSEKLTKIDSNDDFIHYWTDPLAFLELIIIIRDEIIEIDSENKDLYTKNALDYYNRINEIHIEFSNYLINENISDIFFFGHNAMEPFSTRYNLNIVSLSENYQPDAQLTPKQILNLKNNIKEANAKYLFVEELISLSNVNVLKDELASEGYLIEILELHGYHNVSQNQFNEGVTYADLFENNTKNLKKAFTN